MGGWRPAHPLPGAEAVDAWLRSADAIQASAETHTWHRLGLLDAENGGRVVVVLVHSQTAEGRFCAERLAAFAQSHGLQARCRQVDELDYADGPRFNRGLRQLMRVLSEEIRRGQSSGVVELAATGGFTAEIAIANLVGALSDTPVHYVYQEFGSVVTIEPIPVTLRADWIAQGPGRKLLEEFQNPDNIVPRSRIESVLKQDERLLMLVDLDGDDAALNLLGELARRLLEAPVVPWPEPTDVPPASKIHLSDAPHARPQGYQTIVDRLAASRYVTAIRYEGSASGGWLKEAADNESDLIHRVEGVLPAHAPHLHDRAERCPAAAGPAGLEETTESLIRSRRAEHCRGRRTSLAAGGRGMSRWYTISENQERLTVEFQPSPDRFWPPEVIRQWPLPGGRVASRPVLLTGPGAVWMYAHAAAVCQQDGASDITTEDPHCEGASDDVSGCETLLILSGDERDGGTLLRVQLPSSPAVSRTALDRLLAPRIAQLAQLRPRKLVLGGRASVGIYAQAARSAVSCGVRWIACWSARDGLVVVFDPEGGGEGRRITRPAWLMRAMPRPVWPVVVGVAGDPNRGKSIFNRALECYVEQSGGHGWRLDCEANLPRLPSTSACLPTNRHTASSPKRCVTPRRGAGPQRWKRPSPISCVPVEMCSPY